MRSGKKTFDPMEAREVLFAPGVTIALTHYPRIESARRQLNVGSYTPVAPSVNSRKMSAWPQWRASSSIMWM